MISHTTAAFRKTYREMPENIRNRAQAAYRLFNENPNHPSLRFKQVHSVRQIYSVRVTLGYRALAVREGDGIVWFWIGSHGDYEKLIS